jgi:UDP-N-acetylmuramoyl-tripeptide--D-alanyl-D-alanine ligase
MNKINPIIKWWVTPKLPPEDVFAKHNFVTQWIIHPIKRRIAKAYLSFLRKNGNIKVIGITGSTGKTTTTEILASILKNDGKTIWSAEGVDPVYNIPNTILKTPINTKYLILEMSVEYKNEMDFYLWLAKPDIGVITNITKTHTQYLKDEAGVACEKGKLIQNLNKNGTAVLNCEDRLVSTLNVSPKTKIEYFGSGSNVSGSNIVLNQDLSTDFVLQIDKNTKNVHMNAFGKQFVDNALASATVAKTLGIDETDIVKGIEGFKRQNHRLNIIKSSSFGIIFDDTYNSNPKAANESLDTFSVISNGKKKNAVIGDMLELGQFEKEAHQELGKKVGNMDFSCLVCVGNAARFVVEEASKKMGNRNCFLVKDYKEALDIVKPYLSEKSALFIKGSRSLHLDKIVDALIAS